MDELPEGCWVKGSMCQCAGADGLGACRGLSHSGCSAYVPTTKAHKSISAAPAAARQTIHINHPRPSDRHSSRNSDAVTARVTKRHFRSPIKAQGARRGGHRPDHTEAKNSADNPVMSIAAQVSHSNRCIGNIYVDHSSAVQGCSVNKFAGSHGSMPGHVQPSHHRFDDGSMLSLWNPEDVQQVHKQAQQMLKVWALVEGRVAMWLSQPDTAHTPAA